MPILQRPPAPRGAGARRLSGVGVPLLIAAVLILAWLLVDARTPDLASQVYRARLFGKLGMLVWDDNWYRGHYMPSYSLLFPPLGALIGVRTVGVICVLASTALFAEMARRTYGASATLGSCFFAVAAVGDLWIGRITFALGVAFGLGALACMMHAGLAPPRERGRPRSRGGMGSGVRGRRRAVRGTRGGVRGTRSGVIIALAALLAALAAASSPVAGLLLCLAALTEIVAKRRLLHGLPIIVAVAFVTLPLQALFANGGVEPYPLVSFVICSAVGLGFVLALPRAARTLRIGGALFLAANFACLYPTPMGSNVARYAVLLAGPLLLCALRGERARTMDKLAPAAVGRPSLRGAMRSAVRLSSEDAGGSSSEGAVGLSSESALRPASEGAVRLRGEDAVRLRSEGAARLASEGAARLAKALPLALRSLLLAGIFLWVVWGPIDQTRIVLNDPTTSASFYAPVRRFIAAHTNGPVRVQVPFTRSHWETALLGDGSISLAGGWERQLDKRYDADIEADPLSPAVYRNWLVRNAVSYVALPSVPLDGSSAGEAKLIESAPPYLKPVFDSARWRVYEVLGAKPFIEGPAKLLSLRHDSFALRAKAKGKLLIRVHYTPYWTVSEGRGSVGKAKGGWTEVTAATAGRVKVEAAFSLSRALDAL